MNEGVNNIVVKDGALTIKNVGNYAIYSPVYVADNRNPEDIVFNKYRALWDTGCSCTTIKYSVAEQLGLVPFRNIGVAHGGGKSWERVYKADIMLPNKVLYENINVVGCNDSSEPFDVIIGMDIMSTGDFCCSGQGDKRIFTFRYPSRKITDYTMEK